MANEKIQEHIRSLLETSPDYTSVEPPQQWIKATMSQGGLGKVYRAQPDVFDDSLSTHPSANTLIKLRSIDTKNREKKALCYALAARSGDTTSLLDLYKFSKDLKFSASLQELIREKLENAASHLNQEIDTETRNFMSANPIPPSSRVEQLIDNYVAAGTESQGLAAMIERFSQLNRDTQYQNVVLLAPLNTDIPKSVEAIKNKYQRSARHRQFSLVYWDQAHCQTQLRSAIMNSSGPLKLSILGHANVNAQSIVGSERPGIVPVKMTRAELVALLDPILAQFHHPVTINLISCSGGGGNDSIGRYLAENLQRKEKLYIQARTVTCAIVSPSGMKITAPVRIIQSLERHTEQARMIFSQRKQAGFFKESWTCSNALSDLFFNEMLSYARSPKPHQEQLTMKFEAFKKEHGNQFTSEGLSALEAVLQTILLENQQSTSHINYIHRQVGSKVTFYHREGNLVAVDNYTGFRGEDSIMRASGQEVSIKQSFADKVHSLQAQQAQLEVKRTQQQLEIQRVAREEDEAWTQSHPLPPSLEGKKALHLAIRQELDSPKTKSFGCC